MLKPTPTTDPDYAAWEAGLRGRCSSARAAASISLMAADAAGIPQASVARIEGGQSRNVYLDQIASMADCYGVTIAWLVLGEGDPRAGSTPGRARRDNPTRMAATFRTRMRADRMSAGASNDAINVLTGQNPTSRAVTRMESGELRRIDLLRCWRVARAIGVDFASWLSP